MARTIALGLAAAFAAVVAAAAAEGPATMDLIAQYAAASLVLSGQGSAILDPAAVLAAEHAAAPERVALLPFVQPPAVALLLAPLAALPFETALRVMAALDALMIVAALALLRPRPDPVGVAVLLLSPPSVLAIAHGQTSPLVLLLVSLALRSGGALGGCALGLTLLRPQTAPLLLAVGLADPRRRWWTILGALAVVAASALVVGVDGLARYASILIEASSWSASGELGLARAIGWSGLASVAGWPALAIVAPAICLIAGAVAIARADPADRPRSAAAWALVATPHALTHDAVLALPLIARLASRGAPWDAASVAAWLAHVFIAPLGVLWSLVLAARGATTYARPTQ